MCTVALCTVALALLALQSRTVLGEEQQQVICNYFHGVTDEPSSDLLSSSDGFSSQTATVSFDSEAEHNNNSIECPHRQYKMIIIILNPAFLECSEWLPHQCI